MFLRDYQTGLPTTVIAFLAILGGFAYSAFELFHHRTFDGCLGTLMWAMLTFIFHKRFHKDSELP